MKEDGEEYVSHRGRRRGRQPWRKMERKTSTPGEDGEEDISHGGRWRGRHQPWRKTSAMMEDGEEDISNDGRWRGTHQPRRKMERKTSVSKEDGEEDISHGGRWKGREQRPAEGVKTVPVVQPRSALRAKDKMYTLCLCFRPCQCMFMQTV